MGGRGLGTAAVVLATAAAAASLAHASTDTGSSRRDVLRGTPQADRLAGGFGADRLIGLGAGDSLLGESGGDRLDGGLGDDELDGGTGNDRVDGAHGADVLDGGDGDDTLRGGPGSDFVVETGFGNDRLLDGGPGDDYLDANRGNDGLILGGEGDDVLLGGSGRDHLDGGAGDDWLDGGQSTDDVEGGDGQDVLVIRSARPELGYKPGFDHLSAGPGDDVVLVEVPVRLVECGPGNDVLYGQAVESPGCEKVVPDLRQAPALPAPENAGYLRGGPERAQAGSVGEALMRKRSGTAGDDRLEGADVPDGELPDADLLLGKGGHDVLVGNGGDDHLEGETGNDLLLGGRGADLLFGRTGHDRIDGGPDNDVLEGGRGADRLAGGPGKDRLNGGYDADVLRGGAGNDTLVSVGGGRDVLDCGPGNDVVVADSRDVVRNCERARSSVAPARSARAARTRTRRPRAVAAVRCDEPTRGWRRVTAAEAALDQDQLNFALHSYQDRRAYAVRIYRHGCLVATDTNTPASDTAQYEGWGLTRSLLSLLVGRAMQLGFLSPEEPLGALVPEADGPHGAMRIRELLTLTSGLRSSAVRDEDLAVPDRLHDALVTEVLHRPGTRFHESPGAMALLVEALERATGRDVASFAQHELLDHLGIREGTWRWVRDDAGQPHGSYGVNMVVADFARLGELLRRGGVWEGRRLLDERWAREALRGTDVNPCHGWLVFVNDRKGCTRTEDGYRITTNDRLLPGLPADTWQFRGRHDQLVTVMPTEGLMVVRTGSRGGDSRSGEDGGRWERDVGLQLLGAVRDTKPQLTEERGPLQMSRARPYDQPERLSDGLAPYFPPPLPPAGPARARAVVLTPESTTVGRRRIVRVRVACPARAVVPCEGELELETARRSAPFSLAPGTDGVLALRLVRRPRQRVALTARATVRDAVGATTTALGLLLDP